MTFDIIINTELSADTQAEIEKLEELKKLQEETKGTEEEKAEETAKATEDEKLSPEVIEALNSMDTSELEQFLKMGKNPIGSMTKILEKILGSGLV